MPRARLSQLFDALDLHQNVSEQRHRWPIKSRLVCAARHCPSPRRGNRYSATSNTLSSPLHLGLPSRSSTYASLSRRTTRPVARSTSKSVWTRVAYQCAPVLASGDSRGPAVVEAGSSAGEVEVGSAGGVEEEEEGGGKGGGRSGVGEEGSK